MGLNLNFNEKTSLNILTNIIRTLAMALVGILMVPYYVDSLGIASYAIIPLATTMSTYIQLITECIAYSSIRFSAIAFNKDDINEANKTISTSFFGLRRLYLLFLPIGLLLAYLSPYVFSVANSAFDVQMLFVMIIISSMAVTLSIPFNGVFFASNNLYLLYLAKFAYTVSQVLTIIILFTVGSPSLIIIGIGYIVSSILMFIALYVMAKRSEKRMVIKKDLYDGALFKKIGSLAIWSTLTNIGDLLYIQLSLVLVNLYMGTTSQGEFALVVTIVSMMNTAAYTITDSIDALIFKFYSNSDREGMAKMLFTGMKMLAVLITVPVVFLVAFSQEFLGAWVGEEYGHLARLLAIGLLGNVAFCTVLVAKNVPKAFLKVRVPTFITICMGILNAAFTIWILNSEYASTESAMMVWAISTITLSAFNVVYVANLLGIPRYTFLLQILFSYVLVAITYPVMSALNSALNLPPSWGPLIIVLLALFAVYFVVAYILLFSKKEKELIEKMLPARISKHLPKLSIR